MSSFKVYKDKLIALHDHYLTIYQLNADYFGQNLNLSSFNQIKANLSHEAN